MGEFELIKIYNGFIFQIEFFYSNIVFNLEIGPAEFEFKLPLIWGWRKYWMQDFSNSNEVKTFFYQIFLCLKSNEAICRKKIYWKSYNIDKLLVVVVFEGSLY
jgi:hypothetical protein